MSKPNDPFIIPKILTRHLAFQEGFIKIQRDRLQIEQRSPYDYYSLMVPPFAVAILTLTSDGHYVLNKEYRHPTGQVLLGCPGGYLDPGEEPLEAARRELLEETGFQAESLSLIGSAFPYAGFSNQKTFYVRALKASFAQPPSLESSEVIQTCLLSPQALAETIEKGAELDGTLCTALFFHQLHPIQPI